jgi:hypothetical protein
MAGYGTDSALKAYWDASGYTYPVDAAFAALRNVGSVYIDATYGSRFTGTPTAGIAQERAWPRTGATAYGTAIADSAIPVQVENAAYEAAYIALKIPGALSVTYDPAKRVKRQKVDVVEREFFDPGKSANIYAPDAPVSSLIDGILAPLISSIYGLPVLEVV